MKVTRVVGVRGAEGREGEAPAEPMPSFSSATAGGPN
jgi:hypothetical protein